MGTWGADAFDNDSASDWADEFAERKSFEMVGEKLAEILRPDQDYVDSDIASEALVACEILARLKGQWGKRDSYSEEIDQWVLDNPQTPSDDLLRKAILAIDRIAADRSEVAELWAEAGDEEWRASIADLRQRLAAPSK